MLCQRVSVIESPEDFDDDLFTDDLLDFRFVEQLGQYLVRIQVWKVISENKFIKNTAWYEEVYNWARTVIISNLIKIPFYTSVEHIFQRFNQDLARVVFKVAKCLTFFIRRRLRSGTIKQCMFRKK